MSAIWDRDKAREVLGRVMDGSQQSMAVALDALEGCVTPDPATTIPRGALLTLIRGRDWRYWNNPEDDVDAILALLRPDPRIAAVEAWAVEALGGVPPGLRVVLRGES